MSYVYIPEAEIYAADVKVRYQSSQRLQGVMAEVDNNGGAVRNDWVGTIKEMDQVPFGAAALPTSNVTFTPVATRPLRMVIKTAIAEADQSLTNVQLQRAHTDVHGRAAARMVDLLKIRAITENPDIDISSFATIPVTVGPNTGLNTYKLSAGATALNNEDVDMDQRTCWANSDQFDTLFNEDRYINAFTSNKNAINMDLKPYANFDFKMLGKNASNSLPISENAGPPVTYDSIAVMMHFDSMQWMWQIPMRTVVFYDGANLNYVIVTELVANAQVIQSAGIVLANLQLDADGNALPNGG